jgi:hypothetical protein
VLLQDCGISSHATLGKVTASRSSRATLKCTVSLIALSEVWHYNTPMLMLKNTHCVNVQKYSLEFLWPACAWPTWLHWCCDMHVHGQHDSLDVVTCMCMANMMFIRILVTCMCMVNMTPLMLWPACVWPTWLPWCCDMHVYPLMLWPACAWPTWLPWCSYIFMSNSLIDWFLARYTSSIQQKHLQEITPLQESKNMNTQTPLSSFQKISRYFL